MHISYNDGSGNSLGKVYMDSYSGQFSIIIQPAYEHTDFISELGPITSQGNNALCFDRNARAVYPDRQWVPCHNLVVDDPVWYDSSWLFYRPATMPVLPVVWWDAATIGEDLVDDSIMSFPLSYYERQVGYTSNTQPPSTSYAASVVENTLNCHGFKFLFNLKSETSSTSPASLTINWTLGIPADPTNIDSTSEDSTIYYTLQMPIGSPAYVSRTDSSGTSILGAINPTDRSHSLQQPWLTEAPVDVNVWFIGGVMQISIGSTLTPWSNPEVAPMSDEDSRYAWGITEFSLSAENFDVFRFSLHPTKFASLVPGVGETPLISSKIQLPFVPDISTPASFRIHYTPNPSIDPDRNRGLNTTGMTPPGSAATVSIDKNPNNTYSQQLSYDLFFANVFSVQPSIGIVGSPGYWQGKQFSDFTSAVYSVSFGYEPIIYQRTPLPQEMPPEEITVNWDFSFENLMITSSAELVYDNFTGAIGPYFDMEGHLSCTIEMGVVDNNGNGGTEQIFTGIANAQFTENNSVGGVSKVSLQCADCWLPFNTPLWNIPYLDYMNVYYVAYLIGQMGGVTRDRMTFSAYIPDDPYGVTPGDFLVDGNYTNTYFMPGSVSGTALTRVTPGENKITAILKICHDLGFITYFDQYANWHFDRWETVIASYDSSTIISDFYDYATNDASEIWQMSYVGHLRDTRNSVNLIGVNQEYRLLSTQAIDPFMFTEGQPSFQGFVKASYVSDPKYVNPQFADTAARNKLSYQRWPTRMVTFTTAFPVSGALFPLDVVRINYPRSGANGKAFLVYGLTYHQVKGKIPSMTVRGRWYLPELAPITTNAVLGNI